MSNLKSVKEVCEITGLNRKTLFDYKDVVKPAGYKNYMVDDRDGYKLYDDKAVKLLIQIAFYQKLGMQRKEIQELITSDDYDCNKANMVLNAHIKKLEEEKKRLERKIEVAKKFVTYDLTTEIVNTFIDMFDKKRFYSEGFWKYYESKIQSSTDVDTFLLELLNFDELCSDEYLVSLIENFIKSNGIIGIVLVSGIILAPDEANEIALGKGQIIKNCHKKTIFNYLLDSIGDFLAELIGVLYCEDYLRIMNCESYSKLKECSMFEKEKAFEMVEKVMGLCEKYFGIKTKDEFSFILNAIELPKISFSDGLLPFYYVMGMAKIYNKNQS